MLLVGRQRVRTCGGLTRRELLQVGGSTVLGLTLADLLRRPARADGPIPTATATARSVVLLWLWGGPSQLDTWDPKPNAPLEYRGPFASIPTRVPGVRVGELFPQVARLADRFALLVGGRLVASLSATELKDRLADRGVIRLRLGSQPEDLLGAVRALVPAATWAGEELVVPGEATLRPGVLDVVRGLGVEVRGLIAEEGRLDALYRELVAAAPGKGAGS